MLYTDEYKLKNALFPCSDFIIKFTQKLSVYFYFGARVFFEEKEKCDAKYNLFHIKQNIRSSIEPETFVWRSPKITLHGKRERKRVKPLSFEIALKAYDTCSPLRHGHDHTFVQHRRRKFNKYTSGERRRMHTEKDSESLYWISFMHAHHSHPWFTFSMHRAKCRRKTCRHFKVQHMNVKMFSEWPHVCERERKKEGKNCKTFTEKVIWTERTLRHCYQWILCTLTCIFQIFLPFFCLLLLGRRDRKIPTTRIIITTTTTSVIMCFDIFLFNISSCSLFFRLKRLKNYQLLCPYSIWILPLLYFFSLSVPYIHLCVSSSQFFVSQSHTHALSFFSCIRRFLIFHLLSHCISQSERMGGVCVCVYVCEIYYTHQNKLKDCFCVLTDDAWANFFFLKKHFFWQAILGSILFLSRDLTTDFVYG